MENNKMTKEKREALIDSILAETKSGEYKPKAQASVRTVNRQETAEKTEAKGSSAAAENMQKREISAFAANSSPVISNEDKIIESSRITAEKIEKIRREKLEKRKNERLRNEEAEINISQPDFSETEEITPEVKKSKKSGASVLYDVLDVAEWVITVSFIIILVFTYILGIASVSGGSMEPTLKDGDTLLLISAGYGAETGDVVVIDDKKANLIGEDDRIIEKDGLGCKIVKRIIAKGGDTIDFDFEKGIVYVNGKALEEDYISEPTTRDEFAFEYPLTVPEGYVFVMGDNRNISKDSRHGDVGLVSEEDIIGRVILRMYPFSDFGTVK